MRVFFESEPNVMTEEDCEEVKQVVESKKKPPNDYALYVQHRRRNTTNTSMEVIGLEWRTLPEAEKVVFRERMKRLAESKAEANTGAARARAADADADEDGQDVAFGEPSAAEKKLKKPRVPSAMSLFQKDTEASLAGRGFTDKKAVKDECVRLWKTCDQRPYKERSKQLAKERDDKFGELEKKARAPAPAKRKTRDDSESQDEDGLVPAKALKKKIQFELKSFAL
jgi:hypothetical protein